jgi:hypothetical protein
MNLHGGLETLLLLLLLLPPFRCVKVVAWPFVVIKKHTYGDRNASASRVPGKFMMSFVHAEGAERDLEDVVDRR